MQLKTVEDWWAEYTIVKEGIREWGPSDSGIKTVLLAYDMAFIKRTFGERLTTEYMKATNTDPEVSFWTLWDRWEQERNPLMVQVCNSIWADAPDEPYIHGWLHWGRFCDLCSEGPWIFDEAKEAQTPDVE